MPVGVLFKYISTVTIEPILTAWVERETYRFLSMPVVVERNEYSLYGFDDGYPAPLPLKPIVLFGSSKARVW